MTKELLHVGIPESKQIQRSTLEAARATISCLQRFEKFKTVREEKKEAIEEFAVIVKEIYTLDNKLNRILPKTGPPNKKPTKKGGSVPSKEKKSSAVHKKPRKDELAALEKDLANIDDALSKLK